MINTQTKGTLAIYLEDGGWMISHQGAVGLEVMGLFGTTELPSPFLEATPASQVIAVLSELNPEQQEEFEVLTDKEKEAKDESWIKDLSTAKALLNKSQAEVSSIDMEWLLDVIDMASHEERKELFDMENWDKSERFYK